MTALAGSPPTLPTQLLGEARQKTLWRLQETIRAIDEAAPGITSDEYKAFLFVAEHGTAAAKDIAAALSLPQSTTSRHLSRLNGGCDGKAGFGLIDSETDPESRRKVKLTLSPRGIALLARLAVIVGCLLAMSVDDDGDMMPDAGNAYFGSIVSTYDDPMTTDKRTVEHYRQA